MKDAVVFAIIACLAFCLAASILGCEDGVAKRSMARARTVTTVFVFTGKYPCAEHGACTLFASSHSLTEGGIITYHV